MLGRLLQYIFSCHSFLKPENEAINGSQCLFHAMAAFCPQLLCQQKTLEAVFATELGGVFARLDRDNRSGVLSRQSWRNLSEAFSRKEIDFGNGEERPQPGITNSWLWVWYCIDCVGGLLGLIYLQKTVRLPRHSPHLQTHLQEEDQIKTDHSTLVFFSIVLFPSSSRLHNEDSSNIVLTQRVEQKKKKTPVWPNPLLLSLWARDDLF